MEKFLNFSIKYGKTISTVLLALLLFVMLISVCCTLTTFKKVNLQVPKLTEFIDNSNAIYNNDDSGVYVKQYIVSVNKLVKVQNLTTEAKNVILGNISQFDESDRFEYTENLTKFLCEYYSFMQANKKQVPINILIGVVGDYQNEYRVRKLIQNQKITEQKISRILYSSIFAISILLFIICLILPLLIKIEENTRK